MAATTTNSTSSSMTSTSHTMTFLPIAKESKEQNGNSNRTPQSVLGEALLPASRHVFIQPSKDICDAAINDVKSMLDEVATSLVDEQAARRTTAKRKRGDANVEELRIKKLHTEGFEVDQVWEQARRVIDALRGDVVRGLEELGVEDNSETSAESNAETPKGLVKTVRFGEDGFEVGSDDENLSNEESENSEPASDVYFQDEELKDEEEAEGVMEDKDGEYGVDIDDLLHVMEEEDDYEDDQDNTELAETFVEDPHGLNDGFFSIDNFNKQTEFLELQEASADPYTGETSDEDIDWDADPMSLVVQPVSSSRRAAAMEVEDDQSDSEDDDEGGPTFGNADLNASEGDSEDGEDGEDENQDMDDANGIANNTNDILYKDFFEPPPRKVKKGERQANFLDRQAKKPKPQIPGDNQAENGRRAGRELFDDSSESEALSEVDAADPKSRKSAHERQLNKTKQQIDRLEAANVGKREWQLAGEARAADRPMNSLLEEDLDFERTGKPLAVSTAEVSKSIEDRLKRRIVTRVFEEPTRRRPDSDHVTSDVRRGIFELDDTKPKQSLAEMYEEEHIKANNPNTYISKADEKLKKQHQEVEQLWREVSGKLDALSSWHYKPKPPAASLTIVADVATIAMEDAQPTTAGGVAGGESMLAPQEIYKAGKEKAAIEKGEIVLKSGAPVARQEMTREEKLRRRRREKERIKKRGGVVVNKKPEGKKAKERRDTVDELKKANVKVIGKRGEVRDIDGNKSKANVVANGGSRFKL